jgi:hypothetical protein
MIIFIPIYPFPDWLYSATVIAETLQKLSSVRLRRIAEIKS